VRRLSVAAGAAGCKRIEYRAGIVAGPIIPAIDMPGIRSRRGKVV
jgi:hypothetical protein